jgi:NAD(P)H-dependent FMN reductase
MARVLLVSGSTRGGSTNTALLRTAVAVAPAGVEAVLYNGMTALPHFNPDDDVHPLPAAVAGLRAQVGAADAVLICTPEYAGALPGTFKNLLDWSVGGPEMYGKPVAWVNASGSPTRARHAHESLATVLGYIHADVVAAACVHIPVARTTIGADGLVADDDVRRRIATVVESLARYAATRPEWDPAAQSG